ncbi:hypothetical protein LTR62_000913 [Meristemomyces frigidus]|uniref:DUF1917-domain-containing protein n=1 Tax=Meristemomyces frigidus TaxID=1508187 RepID=A0AAN7YGM8_9PEZI|nr:hypothetical protein LTR62_000913 [Meristemomyces frigidus]
MPASEVIDLDGYISDESDFYGNTETRHKLESLVLEPIVWKGGASTRPVKKVKQVIDSTSKQKSKQWIKTAIKPISAASAAASPVNALNFMKSRSQHRAMPSDTIDGKVSHGLVDVDVSEHDLVSWQPPETVLDFLRRAPVTARATGQLGPWLWVQSPTQPYQHVQQRRKTDLATFNDRGMELLSAYRVQQAETEAANQGKAPAAIARYIRLYREQLEDNLLQLAVKTHTTCGKWMLFPDVNDVARVWRVVAEATAAGKLGPISKVATHDQSPPQARARLICVYTYDFTDMADVRRVLDELIALDLVSRSTQDRSIYYKCDAWTYLDLKSDNSYKIKASLYSSKEMLQGGAMIAANGPIVRLAKSKGTIDTFMSG